MPTKKTSMEEKVIRLDGNPFGLSSKQVILYDPSPSSEFSDYIESHLTEIKGWFDELDLELCYIPDICRHFTEEEIRYLVPNWNGEPLNAMGNDFLKPRLNGQYANIGAGFIRKNNSSLVLYNFFPLLPLDKLSWEGQMLFYRSVLLESYNTLSQCADNEIRFSISLPGEGDTYPFYEKKLSRADGDFSEDAISAEVRQIVERLHKEGIEEFVLRFLVPVEGKLSRMVITPDYEIVLPDYGNQKIEMHPMPKAVYLLFLKHEEGLFFKDLVDYKEELRAIYSKITNRTSPDVIDDNLDNVTDPSRNTINEKCSRIREAFIKHIDRSLARSYCITGFRKERKRITLPRYLVEWRCQL